MQPCTEPSSSEGDLEESKDFKLHTYHETIWAHSSSSISEGCVFVWKYEHVRWTPCRFSPPGVTGGAEGEETVNQGDDQRSCPD